MNRDFDSAVTTRATFNFTWHGNSYRVNSDGRTITVYYLTSNTIGPIERLVDKGTDAYDCGVWILRGRPTSSEVTPREYIPTGKR